MPNVIETTIDLENAEALRYDAVENDPRLCEMYGRNLEYMTNPVEVDGHHYCTVGHATRDGHPVCAQCRTAIEPDSGDIIRVSGSVVFCDEDCAHDAGYEQCVRCGSWMASRYGLDINDEFYCCESCAEDDGFTRCERCDEWVYGGDTREVMSDGCERTWCDWCANEYASYCSACDREVDDHEMHFDDEGNRYCNECWSERHPSLHRYGWTPPLGFHGDATKSPYLGIELETDGGYDRATYVRELGEIEGFAEHFWMTEDGSLDNGVEITSHPCTLSYHANELLSVYETIRETALHNDFQSHNGGRCGLHVHVNRNYFGTDQDSQDLGGYKMMRLLQRFKVEFTKFSRRRDNSWCRYETYNNYGPDVPGVPDGVARIVSKSKDMMCETRHEQALNFQHRNTFEFRIFRGTLNLSTFFASLGLINGLCHVAKMHSAHYIETVEWTQLMLDTVKACDEPKCRDYLRDYLESKALL